jgi:hypothetical protein
MAPETSPSMQITHVAPVFASNMHSPYPHLYELDFSCLTELGGTQNYGCAILHPRVYLPCCCSKSAYSGWNGRLRTYMCKDICMIRELGRLPWGLYVLAAKS